MADDFGDFEEIKDESVVVENGEQGVIRVRLPKRRELIGFVVQRYGGNRMEIQSSDGKKRNCRVPGRFKRDLWLRPGDYVLIEPWEDDDEKGDIIYKYNAGAINQLRKRGLLDSLKKDF
jgi:translation initiation factor 1A